MSDSVYSYILPAGATLVNNGVSQTVAQLLANFPASLAYVGMYGRVSDLWGSVDEVMRCAYDGSTYYWRPQRTDYTVNSAQTSGGVSLVPLVNAPQLIMTATLLGNITVTPSSLNAWPGCRFEVTSPAALGIFSLTFGGLVGGILGGLLGGSTRVLEYTAAGWKGK